jgi:hypothetical protein
MIDNSNRNWSFYMYHQDEHDVYNELKRQVETKYKDQVKVFYSGCQGPCGGQYCDGAHGDTFTFVFATRDGEESIDLRTFVKQKN